MGALRSLRLLLFLLVASAVTTCLFLLWTLNKPTRCDCFLDSFNTVEPPLTQHNGNPKHRNEPVHVVFASDENDTAALHASISSVRSHASGPVVFHVIGAQKSKTITTGIPDVNFYDLSEISKKYNLSAFENPHIQPKSTRLNSHANYARFILPLLLHNVSKVMWLDTDVITQCDVVHIVKSALTANDFVIAAFQRQGTPSPDILKSYSLKITNSTRTFNAGIFVADLERWRQLDITESILTYVEKNRKEKIYRYGSQTPMNLVIGDEYERFNSTWLGNGLGFIESLQVAELKQKCFLHWNGSKKPWQKNGLYKELWEPYLYLEAVRNISTADSST